jgi:exosortase/archaeosortase family protein
MIPKSGPPIGHVSDPSAGGGKAMRRFLGIFLAAMAVYYALTLSPWVDANLLYPVMKASAHGTSVLLKLIGINTTVEGVVVRGPAYSMTVRRGCDPLDPLALFAAGLFSFPAPGRYRLAGLAVGSAFLFGLNLTRLVSLYLLGARKSSWFESLHLWWWPAFFMICTLALWVLWLRWVQRSSLATKSVAVMALETAKPLISSLRGKS